MNSVNGHGHHQNLQRKSTDGRWGGQITPGFVERFGRAYDVELQEWVDAVAGDGELGPSSWDGYAATAVSDAGLTALRTGERVPVSLGDRPALYEK